MRVSSGNGFLVTTAGGIDHFNINATNSRVEIPRAVDFQMYSDSYSTETLKIEGDTGDIIWGDNAAGPLISAGTGSPEGVKSAPVGSLYLRSDGTVNTLYTKISGSGSTGWVAPTSPMILPLNVTSGTSHTITAMPLAATLLGSGRCTIQVDLSRFTRVRLSGRITSASASPNNPRIRLRYRTSYSNLTSDFLEIGASEVSIPLTSVTSTSSAWTDLVPGARGDVFVSVDTIGGDGTASPIIALLIATFE